MNDLHDELAFGTGPILWDADPTVCCAAYQLGACEHSEVYEPTEAELAEDRAAHEALLAEDPAYAAFYARIEATPVGVEDDEPF